MAVENMLRVLHGQLPHAQANTLLQQTSPQGRRLPFAQLLAGTPYALGMVQRLRRDHGYADEPSNVFSFPASF